MYNDHSNLSQQVVCACLLVPGCACCFFCLCVCPQQCVWQSVCVSPSVSKRHSTIQLITYTFDSRGVEQPSTPPLNKALYSGLRISVWDAGLTYLLLQSDSYKCVAPWTPDCFRSTQVYHGVRVNNTVDWPFAFQLCIMTDFALQTTTWMPLSICQVCDSRSISESRKELYLVSKAWVWIQGLASHSPFLLTSVP